MDLGHEEVLLLSRQDRGRSLLYTLYYIEEINHDRERHQVYPVTTVPTMPCGQFTSNHLQFSYVQYFQEISDSLFLSILGKQVSPHFFEPVHLPFVFLIDAHVFRRAD